jgi:hypothetical protein
MLRTGLAGGESGVIVEELKSHGRARTDLTLWDGECLIGIEAKLRDWKRVISQAVLNRLCYDRSYLAMWSSVISEAVIEEASRFGIGVIALDADGIEVLLDAQRQDPIPELRQRLIQSIDEAI